MSTTRHLLTLADCSVPDIVRLVNGAQAWKRAVRGGTSAATQTITSSVSALPSTSSALLARGKTLGLLFSKRSTRTRLAGETGFAYLGGHAIFLGRDDIQLGVNESLQDTARVVGSMCDVVLYRGESHADVEEFARHSRAPVVNGLTNTFHPTQILADLLTMHETFTAKRSTNPRSDVAPPFTVDALRGLNVAWVGDANNIVNSLLVTCPRLGINMNIATPQGYNVKKEVLARMNEVSREFAHGAVRFTTSPEEAVRDADVVITDTWVSMGQEEEKKRRVRDFAGFQITHRLMERGRAHPEWKFMHCLPRKPEEVNDEVFYDSTRSLVFEEAENRKYAMMSVFEWLLRGRNDRA